MSRRRSSKKGQRKRRSSGRAANQAAGRRQRMIWAFGLAGIVAAAGIGFILSRANQGKVEAVAERKRVATTPVHYGTAFPNKAVVDPDAPVHEGGTWSASMVKEAFSRAKKQNNAIYRAYQAANEHSHLLEYAFCSCGCDASAGHRSAADCFKDMHGFGCLHCQKIALRAGELVDQGRDEETVKTQLSREFPRP